MGKREVKSGAFKNKRMGGSGRKGCFWRLGSKVGKEVGGRILFPLQEGIGKGEE